MSTINRYTPEDIKKIWSAENKYSTWLKVELAVCRVRNRLGLIPDKDMKSIEERAGFNTSRIEEIEKEVHHDVISFLTSVAEKVGPPSRHIHYGMTSSDILDTSTALLLRDSGNLIITATEELLTSLKEKSEKYKYNIMIGRTHGVHAEPITLGLKFLSFYANVKRGLKKLISSVEEISYGKISGPVGVYGEITPVIENKALEMLGLKPEPVSTQIVPRDRHMSFIMSLSYIALSLERIALQIRLLQRTETNEIQEPFSKKQKGSSAMPHKRNPIVCERICGLSRLFRGFVTTSMDNISLWDERDISHSSAERILFPEATTLLLYMLRKTNSVVKNIKVNINSIKNNLDISKERYLSGKILLALCDSGMERDKAYKIIQEAALNAQDNNTSLLNNIMKNKKISELIGKKRLDQIKSDSTFNKHIDLIFKRVLYKGGD